MTIPLESILSDFHQVSLFFLCEANSYQLLNTDTCMAFFNQHYYFETPKIQNTDESYVWVITSDSKTTTTARTHCDWNSHNIFNEHDTRKTGQTKATFETSPCKKKQQHLMGFWKGILWLNHPLPQDTSQSELQLQSYLSSKFPGVKRIVWIQSEETLLTIIAREIDFI